MSNEIQTRPEQSEASMMPTSFRGAMKLAEFLATSSLVPTAFRGKPADIMVVMMTGREYRISPMVALSSIHVIEGRPSMSAELLGALVMRSAECEYLMLAETSDKIATYETKRRGHPRATTYSYTIEQAISAGLAGKANWKAHTAAMLRARAISGIARAVYPDVTKGLVTTDEAEEIGTPATIADQLAEAPARPRTLDQLSERMQAPPAQEIDVTPATPQADAPKAAPKRGGKASGAEWAAAEAESGPAPWEEESAPQSNVTPIASAQPATAARPKSGRSLL